MAANAKDTPDGCAHVAKSRHITAFIIAALMLTLGASVHFNIVQHRRFSAVQSREQAASKLNAEARAMMAKGLRDYFRKDTP